jgi:hypothetical protein
MRSVVLAAVVTAMGLSAREARADGPDPAVAVVVGAASVVAGFVVGGTLTATSPGSPPGNEAGWFAIEGGFSLAPLLAHGVVGEWGRGAVFAAVPTATTLATVPVFASNDAAVEHGTLTQQRIMWGLFCGGLATSMVGIIDAAMASGRAVQVAPVLGPHGMGLTLGGTL